MNEEKKKNNLSIILVIIIGVISITVGSLLIINKTTSNNENEKEKEDDVPPITDNTPDPKKNELVNAALVSILEIRNEVNRSEKPMSYEEGVFYLIKINHVKENACVWIERDGQSPFNDTWNYNYVGITYDGDGYSYYYMGQDASGYGVDLVSEIELTRLTSGNLVTTELLMTEELKTLYNKPNTTVYVTGMPIGDEIAMNNNLKARVDIAVGQVNDDTIYNKIVIINTPDCEYDYLKF